jgi:hypothetical protein
MPPLSQSNLFIYLLTTVLSVISFMSGCDTSLIWRGIMDNSYLYARHPPPSNTPTVPFLRWRISLMSVVGLLLRDTSRTPAVRGWSALN